MVENCVFALTGYEEYVNMFDSKLIKAINKLFPQNEPLFIMKDFNSGRFNNH